MEYSASLLSDVLSITIVLRGTLGNEQDGYVLSTCFISLDAYSFVIYYMISRSIWHKYHE